MGVAVRGSRLLTHDCARTRSAWGTCCRPNDPEVNPRGQGLRGYGSAARRIPALEARDAGGVTPFKIPLNGLSGAHGIRSCPLM